MKLHLAFATALFACAQIAVADRGGRCHFHGNAPAKEETVQRCALERRDALIEAGKLDATWKQARPERIEQVEGKKGKEWKVSLKNPVAKDAGKDTLYVFFTLPGNYIAANYTGQ